MPSQKILNYEEGDGEKNEKNLSEVRWTGVGEEMYENFNFIYSGGDNHHRGVGAILLATSN